jgi:hypothetical protein
MGACAGCLLAYHLQCACIVKCFHVVYKCVLITIIQGASMMQCLPCFTSIISFFCAVNNIQSGPVVETIAYDLLLEAAMHAQLFHSRNLRLHGSWKWLLIEFADYYGVSDSYTKLRCL